MNRSGWENQWNNSVLNVAAVLGALGRMWAEYLAKKNYFSNFEFDSPEGCGASREWLEGV